MKLSLSICCVQTQTRGEVVSRVLLTFARAYFCTTVCQKASATENSTFYTYFYHRTALKFQLLSYFVTG